MIYFITAREVGRVKIGFSDEPRLRFVKMRTDSPIPLELERICEGDQLAERALHERFAAHRLSGEWFAICPVIERHMNTLEVPTFKRREPIGGALGHWMRRNDHTLSTFAELVGTTQATLSRVCAGKHMPRRELMIAIIEATGWEVDANALLGLHPRIEAKAA